MKPFCVTRNERGSAVVELTVLAPLLLLLLLLAVVAGRLVDARMQVDDAAHDAARAASIQRTAGSANASAKSAASATLEDEHTTCRNMSLTTDTSNFYAGGSVSVDLTCQVDLSDLTMLHLGGSRTIEAHAMAVIDQFTTTGQ